MSNKFNKIVCVDRIDLQDRAWDELQHFSKEKIDLYEDYPETEEEILRRIEGADAVIVSWHTHLDERILSRCPDIKYIGMACTLYNEASANVAVDYARERNIVVKDIRDYGDRGVAEFVISEIIRLLHGLGKHQWREMPEELMGKKIGIIGLGTTGQLLAKCLQPLGADIYYYSRTRKKEWEEKGVKYLLLEDLLKTAEIISFHLPRKSLILGATEFNHLGDGKILVNTSLGLPFEEEAFNEWRRGDGNFAIFDGDGKRELSVEAEKYFNVLISEKSAGWSVQTQQRLSEKVLQNLKDYLDQ